MYRIGYTPNEHPLRLSTFELESTVPVITEINDGLTMGSIRADYENRGITEYNYDNRGEKDSMLSERSKFLPEG